MCVILCAIFLRLHVRSTEIVHEIAFTRDLHAQDIAYEIVCEMRPEGAVYKCDFAFEWTYNWVFNLLPKVSCN
jgi:hypothetical protein